MEAEETTEERLERLRRATESIRARGDFAGRLLARVAAEPPWPEILLSSARRLLPLALVAAALSCSLAYRSHQDAGAALVWSEDPVGASWE
jgi:hypothetical protein